MAQCRACAEATVGMFVPLHLMHTHTSIECHVVHAQTARLTWCMYVHVCTCGVWRQLDVESGVAD